MGMNGIATCLGALLATGMLLMPGAGECAQTLVQRLDRLLELEDSSAGGLTSTGRAAGIAARFDQDFGQLRGTDLRELELPQLQAFYRAAELAQFYAHRDQDLEAMEAAFSELARREQASPEDLQGMFGAYISMRAFDTAGRFASTHQVQMPETLPEVVNRLPPGFVGPSLLQPTASGAGVARIMFAPSADAHIVAVSHPMCGFTRRAIAAIEADPELTNLFRDKVYWITPVDRRLHLDMVRNWNEAHPLTQFAFAWRRDEWPAIDHWGTPTFYFFANGELVAKVTGWPEEGRRKELIAAARIAGIQ